MSIRRTRRSFLGRASTLLALFLLGSASRGAFAQIEPATAELVDTAGTVVGPVLDFYDREDASVALLVDGHSTILSFTPNTIDTLHVLGGTGVYFASTDCTGQAYAVTLGTNEFLEPQAVGGLNFTFYAGAPGAILPGQITFQSLLFAGAECMKTQMTTQESAVPVFPVRDLSPAFQPPFHIVNTRGATPVPAVSTLGLAAIALALALGGLFLLRLRAQR